MKKILLSAVALAATLTMSAQVTTYSVGQTVADFTVTDTQGNTWNLYTITAGGQHVFLDFFFDTCPPCQSTETYYSELYDKYGCNDGDIFVISINDGSDNNAMVDAFFATYGGPWNHPPAVSNQGGAAAVDSQFGIGAYPTYCLIGPDNKMVNIDIWPISNVGTFEAAFPQPFTPMSCSVGLEEEEELSNLFNIYPNPATDQVNVSIELEEAADIELVVYNVLGETVITENAGNMVAGETTYSLATTELENGNYFVRLLVDGEESGYTKFAIAR